MLRAPACICQKRSGRIGDANRHTAAAKAWEGQVGDAAVRGAAKLERAACMCDGAALGGARTASRATLVLVALPASLQVGMGVARAAFSPPT
jgi:hypothetical protein